MSRNRVDLSRGRIRCVVLSDDPLPSTAFGVVSELAAAVEEADGRLADLVPTPGGEPLVDDGGDL